MAEVSGKRNYFDPLVGLCQRKEDFLSLIIAAIVNIYDFKVKLGFVTKRFNQTPMGKFEDFLLLREKMKKKKR